MTDTAQDTFLRELAEALGWEYDKRSCKWLLPKMDDPADCPVQSEMTVKTTDGDKKMFPAGFTPPKYGARQVLSAFSHYVFVDPRGTAYLVARARAEGYRRREVELYEGFTRVTFYTPVAGGGRIRQSVNKDNAEPEATAYAVAKMLKVKLPKGVE